MAAQDGAASPIIGIAAAGSPTLHVASAGVQPTPHNGEALPTATEQVPTRTRREARSPFVRFGFGSPPKSTTKADAPASILKKGSPKPTKVTGKGSRGGPEGRGAGQEPTKSAMVREQAPYRSRNVNGAGSRRLMQTTILAFAVVVRAQCVCIAPRTTTHLVCAVLAAGLPTSQDDKDEIKQMRKELKEAKDEISRLQGELKTKDALMKSEVEKAKAQAEAENQKAVQAAFERGCEFAKSMLK